MDPHLHDDRTSPEVSSPASPVDPQSSTSRSPVQTQNPVAFVKGGKRKRLSKVRERCVPTFQSV